VHGPGTEILEESFSMSSAASATELEAVQENVEEQTSRWTSGSAIVLYIAVAKLIVQLLAAPRYGFHVDELYFLGCSEHLDWGYIDQPPLKDAGSVGRRSYLGLMDANRKTDSPLRIDAR
jgi:hypothetical protein